MARTLSKSRVSNRTFKRHAEVWSNATTTIAQMLDQAEEPEQYFLEHEATIHDFEFVSKSRRGLNAFGKIRLAEFYENVALDLAAAVEQWCMEARDYMKENHPWNNQTGDAERGLNATVAGMEDGRFTMYLYHNIPLERHGGIEYGTILETYTYPRAGLLRIIQPTIELYGPQLTASLQGVLDR